jgi:hypothetical protein
MNMNMDMDMHNGDTDGCPFSATYKKPKNSRSFSKAPGVCLSGLATVMAVSTATATATATATWQCHEREQSRLDQKKRREGKGSEVEKCIYLFIYLSIYLFFHLVRFFVFS